MLIDGLNLVEGSENTNLVVTNVTEAQRAALTNVNAGEVVFVTDGSAPGLYTYDGANWVPAKDDLSGYYTKTAADALLAAKAASADVYTKTAADALLAAKAPLASPTFTGTVSGITATMVGLSNVNNTADSAKPVSTAQQTALDLKADKSTTFTKTETNAAIQAVVGAAPAALDTLQEIAAQLATDESAASALTTAVSLKAPLASPTFTGTVSGITATMVGLGNVNNTADSAKPVSTAQQTALDLKANLASPALTGTPTAPTATAGTNTTQVATTAFVLANAVAQTTVNTVTGRVQDSDGNLRSIPQVAKTSAYSLLASDNGKNINITTGGVTLTNALAAGDVVSIYNQSGSAQNISWSGLTVYLAGTSTAKTSPLSLSARGVLTAMYVSATEIVVSGNV